MWFGWLMMAVLAVLLVFGVAIAVHLVMATWNGSRTAFSVPTPGAVAPEVLEALGLKPGAVLYELGCGDGRLLVAALRAEPSVRAVGVENDPVLAGVARLRVGRRAQVVLGDLMEQSLGEADRVFAYLSPRLMSRLEPRFEKELRKGARVVSLQFAMPGRKPTLVIDLEHGMAHANRLYVYDY